MPVSDSNLLKVDSVVILCLCIAMPLTRMLIGCIITSAVLVCDSMAMIVRTGRTRGFLFGFLALLASSATVLICLVDALVVTPVVFPPGLLMLPSLLSYSPSADFLGVVPAVLVALEVMVALGMASLAIFGVAPVSLFVVQHVECVSVGVVFICPLAFLLVRGFVVVAAVFMIVSPLYLILIGILKYVVMVVGYLISRLILLLIAVSSMMMRSMPMGSVAMRIVMMGPVVMRAVVM